MRGGGGRKRGPVRLVTLLLLFVPQTWVWLSAAVPRETVRKKRFKRARYDSPPAIDYSSHRCFINPPLNLSLMQQVEKERFHGTASDHGE